MNKLKTGWRQASILRRVLVPMLIVFVLTVVVSATVVRRLSLQELEEVLTANLSTSAKSLFGVLRLQLSDDVQGIQAIFTRYNESHGPLADELLDDSYHSAQANLRYVYLQINVSTQNVVVSSRQRPLIPATVHRTGFFDVREGDRNWQVFGISDEASGAWFYMGQSDDYLLEIKEESNFAMIIALLLLSPLLAAIVWYGVLRGLRPLRELSAEIDQRESGNMQALSLEPAMRETKPLVNALNELLHRLTTALQKERQFTADAAHELRTPIASLRAQLGVLDGARSEAERLQAVRGIDRAAERMSSLVSNLLALARLDSSAQMPPAKPYDLRISLEQVIAEHVFVAMEKNVEISLYGMLRCPLTGAAYLHELLAANLIANAVKYTPPGGRVDVYLENTAQRVVYRVEDTGPGVPEHELPHLTERFRRVRQSGGESVDGAGLGLSIAARCAQLADVELDLKNRLPYGLCATVRL